MQVAPAEMEFCAMSITFKDSSRILVAVLCQDSVDFLRHQTAIYIVIDGHDRSQTASANTAASGERELPVCSALLWLDAERSAHLVQDCRRTLYIASGSQTIEILYLPFGVRENWE